MMMITPSLSLTISPAGMPVAARPSFFGFKSGLYEKTLRSRKDRDQGWVWKPVSGVDSGTMMQLSMNAPPHRKRWRWRDYVAWYQMSANGVTMYSSGTNTSEKWKHNFHRMTAGNQLWFQSGCGFSCQWCGWTDWVTYRSNSKPASSCRLYCDCTSHDATSSKHQQLWSTQADHNNHTAHS